MILSRLIQMDEFKWNFSTTLHWTMFNFECSHLWWFLAAPSRWKTCQWRLGCTTCEQLEPLSISQQRSGKALSHNTHSLMAPVSKEWFGFCKRPATWTEWRGWRHEKKRVNRWRGVASPRLKNLLSSVTVQYDLSSYSKCLPEAAAEDNYKECIGEVPTAE